MKNKKIAIPVLAAIFAMGSAFAGHKASVKLLAQPFEKIANCPHINCVAPSGVQCLNTYLDASCTQAVTSFKPAN